MNAFTASDEAELGAFIHGGVQKTGKPGQGNADASPIGERNRQLVL
jgi:hypothetical protein